jgi:hypothetical protein
MENDRKDSVGVRGGRHSSMMWGITVGGRVLIIDKLRKTASEERNKLR